MGSTTVDRGQRLRDGQAGSMCTEGCQMPRLAWRKELPNTGTCEGLRSRTKTQDKRIEHLEGVETGLWQNIPMGWNMVRGTEYLYNKNNNNSSVLREYVIKIQPGSAMQGKPLPILSTPFLFSTFWGNQPCMTLQTLRGQRAEKERHLPYA